MLTKVKDCCQQSYIFHVANNLTPITSMPIFKLLTQLIYALCHAERFVDNNYAPDNCTEEKNGY
jgi:hypothetical protein